MRVNDNEILRYTEEFKMHVVSEVEAGRLSQREAGRMYHISKSTVWDWIQVYGKIENKKRIVEVVMSDQKEKIEEMEKALSEAHLKIRLYEKMIELADKHYKTDIKKNFPTEASKALKKPGGK